MPESIELKDAPEAVTEKKGRWVPVAFAARKVYRCSEWTIRRWIKSGRLTARNRGVRMTEVWVGESSAE